jgi:crotonobetainyl-CoA:carnitine CoA-transferase CaiB-like acyl-CoA transferase
VYDCADGKQVTVTSTEPKAWAALVQALDLPELAGFRRGVDDDAAATARVAERMRTKPAAVWLEDPGLEGGVGPVHDPVDLIDDPQLIDRGSLVPLPGSGDKVFANPIRFDSADGTSASYGLCDPPHLGEHTAQSLQEVGFDQAEIDTLLHNGVVL